MKRTMLILCLLVLAVAAGGCRLSVNRLNKRYERWQSMKKKAGNVEQKVKFAQETLYYFLSNADFQRSKETLVTEAERLHYHQILSDMQIFLMDYHAQKALDLTSAAQDWKRSDLEYARADSLSHGLLACSPHTTYMMVMLQEGYGEYLRQISAQGERYERLEKQFPGVMEAFRKMSRYQYLKAEKLYAEGDWKEALTHYLLVFKRDTQDFAAADQRVRYLEGQNIRQVYDKQYLWDRYIEAFQSLRLELYSLADNQIMRAQSDSTQADWTTQLPDIWKALGEKYNCKPEQAADLYFMLKNEREGTLSQYVSLWRYDVLKGNPPLLPDITDVRG